MGYPGGMEDDCRGGSMHAVGKAFVKGEKGVPVLGGIGSCWGYSGAERWDRSDPRGEL